MCELKAKSTRRNLGAVVVFPPVAVVVVASGGRCLTHLSGTLRTLTSPPAKENASAHAYQRSDERREATPGGKE